MAVTMSRAQRSRYDNWLELCKRMDRSTARIIDREVKPAKLKEFQEGWQVDEWLNELDRFLIDKGQP